MNKDAATQTAPRVAVIGGGAAGYFAAIFCKGENPQALVTIFEQSARGLKKVLASGGGRCNLTNACDDPQELIKNYPRGGRELLGPFYEFGPEQASEWFEAQGVKLKTEADGRVFPASDSSGSVARCLESVAHKTGVRARMHCTLTEIAPQTGGGFKLWFNGGEFSEVADAVLLACGGMRDGKGLADLARALGHEVQPPLPSLFTFKCRDERLAGLAGVSVPEASIRAELPQGKNQTPPQSGALLITHRGFSGPAALRLSAWQAKVFHAAQYRFNLKISWLGEHNEGSLGREFVGLRQKSSRRFVVSHSPFEQIPLRLWKRLCEAAKIAEATTWNTLDKEAAQRLARELCAGTFAIEGRAQNKEEFVTCGGVDLKQVHFKTMQSRLLPGLFFAGEFLDIDAVTGGFNIQAAWTTGAIAGKSMAQVAFHENLC